ncbi:head-tail joining protein [Azospirillum himalayense]|uniref:Uncharacterized protein n=1 Tax=Azospirillum himalayense TaxID=654847 RepID=A0ABW0GFA5_9PROT
MTYGAQQMAVQFRVLGVPALYTPPTGDSIPCRAIRATQPLRFGTIDLPVEGACFDLLRSEVAPAVGGTFTVGGATYSVDIPPIPFPVDHDPEGLRARLLCGWGTSATFRATTGNQNTLNPPTGSGWIVATAAPAGASTVSIKATLTTGQLLTGDRAVIGGEAFAITAPVSAAGNVFANVPLDRALPAPVAAGAPAAFSFACDRPLKAAVRSFEAGQLLGGIVVGDQRLIVPQVTLDVAGVPVEPSAAHSVLIGAQRWRVKTAVAARQAGVAVLWDLHVGA